MEIDDKGGEIVQRYDRYGGEIRYMLDMDMNKREHHQRKENDQNSWTKEAHKQGEQAHELCLIVFDMCIFMCLLALHKFLKFNMHACVVYASYRT